MQPNMEQPKQYTPEEMAQLEKSRTISDAELLKGGAEYVVDEKENKRLEIKSEHLSEIARRKEGGLTLEQLGSLINRAYDERSKKLKELNEFDEWRGAMGVDLTYEHPRNSQSPFSWMYVVVSDEYGKKNIVTGYAIERNKDKLAIASPNQSSTIYIPITDVLDVTYNRPNLGGGIKVE